MNSIQPYLAWAQGQRSERPLRQLLSCEAVLEIPRDVATCPKCDATLYAHFEEWEKDDDSLYWDCMFAKLECESEPSINSRKWDEWFRWHYDMPYVYWMPLEVRLTKWVNERYCFDCGN